MKKLLSAALLLAVMLTACGEAASAPVSAGGTAAAPDAAAETAAETAEEAKAYIPDSLPDADLGGYKFRIGTSEFGGKNLNEYVIFDELTGNPVNDELYNAKLYVENRFNVDISVIDYGTIEGTRDAVKKSVAAGDDEMDIQIGHDHHTGDLAKGGYLHNIRSIPHFDFDKPWWPKFAIDQLTVCHRMYVCSSYISYCGLSYERILCVNKTLADSYGRAIPYDAVRDGKWTLDAMFGFIADTAADLDGDGKMGETDQYGFVSGSQTDYCLQEALDCSVYKKDENDVPTIEADMDRLSKMVEKTRWLYKDSGLATENVDFGQNIFKAGLSLLAYTQITNAYNDYRQSDVVYGFLPTPKLDELQADYINCCTDTPWAIPLNASHPEEIGYVVEALSCYNYNNVLPAYFDVAVKTRLADSPDDAEMLQIIADTRTIGFAYFYSMSFNNIIGDLKNGKKELASYIEKGMKSATKNLDKLIAAFEGMDE